MKSATSTDPLVRNRIPAPSRCSGLDTRHRPIYGDRSQLTAVCASTTPRSISSLPDTSSVEAKRIPSHPGDELRPQTFSLGRARGGAGAREKYTTRPVGQRLNIRRRRRAVWNKRGARVSRQIKVNKVLMSRQESQAGYVVFILSLANLFFIDEKKSASRFCDSQVPERA